VDRAPATRSPWRSVWIAHLRGRDRAQSSKLAATVSDKVNNEELRRWLEGLNDEDLGRYKM